MLAIRRCYSSVRGCRASLTVGHFVHTCCRCVDIDLFPARVCHVATDADRNSILLIKQIVFSVNIGA